MTSEPLTLFREEGTEKRPFRLGEDFVKKAFFPGNNHSDLETTLSSSFALHHFHFHQTCLWLLHLLLLLHILSPHQDAQRSMMFSIALEVKTLALILWAIFMVVYAEEISKLTWMTDLAEEMWFFKHLMKAIEDSYVSYNSFVRKRAPYIIQGGRYREATTRTWRRLCQEGDFARGVYFMVLMCFSADCL